MGGAGSGGRTGSGSGGASGTAGITGSAGAPSTGGVSGSGGGGTACTLPQGAGGGSITCSPPTPPSAKDSVTLDMAVAQGSPTYLASGFIYGIAEDGTQPPTSLLSDIKVKGFRAGRGQSEGCGAQAWATHWNVIKAYYSRAKEVGATYLLLVSDDYGYFCTWPGDGGDWTGLTTFMTQLISNVQAAGMTGPDVRWELWNEPELSLFWNGTQAQWLETWKHAYQQIRAAIPGAVIEGPSLATGPGGSWMNTFLDYAKTNDVMPDYISWHEEGGGADPVADLATINRQLTSRGITGVKGFDANEYGTTSEQNPGHSAWFLARFDRAGFQGLRGNWADATFFSNMAELVAANWQPNSQYWVYKRYARSDRPSHQRHGGDAGGRGGLSGCVRGQIHHRRGQQGWRDGGGQRRHQEHPGLAAERWLNEGPLGKDADWQCGAHRPGGRHECRRHRDLQCDDRHHRLGHRHRRLRRHLEPALSGALLSQGRALHRNLRWIVILSAPPLLF